MQFQAAGGSRPFRTDSSRLVSSFCGKGESSSILPVREGSREATLLSKDQRQDFIIVFSRHLGIP